MKNIFTGKIFEKISPYLAVLFFVLIPVWIYFILPEQLEIDRDLYLEFDVDSYDNFYSLENSKYIGEQSSITKFSYEVVGVEGAELDIKNSFEVSTISAELIFKTGRDYFIDSHTGKHVSEKGEVYRDGYLFAPRMKGLVKQAEDKSSFTYWHVNYNEPISLDFRNEESLFGLETYRYEDNFIADQTKELTGILPGVGEDKGIELNVHIEVWVETYTGRIIKYEDDTEAYYYDLETKEKLYPWNKFRNSINPNSASEYAKDISILKEKYILLNNIVTFLLILLVLFFAFFKSIKSAYIKFSKNKNKVLLTSFGAFFAVFILTILFTSVFVNINRDQRGAEFESEVRKVSNSISDRLSIYANALRGARGLFDASNDVSREEWKLYVDSLSLQTEYPGIQALGYSKVISPDEVGDIVQSIKDQGFEDFNISPDYERDVYTSIIYIEPFDVRNRLAFGYDMFTEENRRNAMEFSRDSGRIAISGKVSLLQEGETGTQAGFLMYEPVYINGDNNFDIESRRENILGYVYSAFRMNNLMIGIFSKDDTLIDIEIFDAANDEQFNEDNLLYRSESIDDNYSIKKTEFIEVYGKTWAINYYAPASFGFDALKTFLPYLIFVFGFLMSIGAFSLVYILTTRKEKAVQIADKMTKGLQIEKARTESILAGIGDGLFVTDVSGNVLFVNKAFEILTGYKEDEVLNKRLVDFLPLYKKKKTLFAKADRPLSYVLKNKKQVHFGSSKFLSYKLKDGSLLPVSVTVSPIFAEGEFIGAVEVFRDITQEREIDTAKSEFVSLASHQLRTPVSVINWYLELLLDEGKKVLTKKQKEYILEAESASKRMTNLINSLLNVSRLELGTVTINPQESDIVEVIKSAVKEQENSFKEKKQKLETVYSKTIPKIKIDWQIVHMIVQNLLSNAHKYTPEKGKIKLSVKNKKVGDKKYVSIICEDNGYGIPKSEQKNVFKKLERASNVKKLNVEGTGLGLYIIKTVVDVSGSEITFKSEENKGTTFEVKIPLSGMKKVDGSKRLGR